MTARWICSLGGLLVAGGLASGCSSGVADKPTSSMTPSQASASPSSLPSASTVTSASPSTPSPSYSVPPEARVRSEDGATAFLNFYVEQLNKAWTTPSADVLGPLFQETCKTCANHQSMAVSYVETKHHYESAPVGLAQVTVRPNSTDVQVFFDAVLRQNKSEVVDVNGTVVESLPREEFNIETSAVWGDDGWQIYAMARRQ